MRRGGRDTPRPCRMAVDLRREDRVLGAFDRKLELRVPVTLLDRRGASPISARLFHSGSCASPKQGEIPGAMGTTRAAEQSRLPARAPTKASLAVYARTGPDDGGPFGRGCAHWAAATLRGRRTWEQAGSGSRRWLTKPNEKAPLSRRALSERDGRWWRTTSICAATRWRRGLWSSTWCWTVWGGTSEILSASGWNIGVNGKHKVDYVLVSTAGGFLAVVEAKAADAGTQGKHVRDASGYATELGAPYAVLTNGGRWEAWVMAPGRRRDNILVEVNLTTGDVPEIAAKLSRLCWTVLGR